MQINNFTAVYLFWIGCEGNGLTLHRGQNSTNAQHGVWRYRGKTLLASAVALYQLHVRLASLF